MRKKALALLVAMALAATAVTGCSTGSTSDTKTTSNKTTTLTGTVTKVGDSSITISTSDNLLFLCLYHNIEFLNIGC